MGVSRRKQVSFGFTALSESESVQTNEKPFSSSIFDQRGISELAFTMGKWSLTENLATVGRILLIFSADPHEI